MSIMARLEQIERRVGQLERLDRGLEVFGASSHEHQLAPPLDEADLAAFERAAGVTLPDDHRAFLLRVGSSGAGPYYGLLPLPQGDALGEASLSSPFVGDSTDPAVLQDPGAMGGALLLADHGCGYRSLLALTGPRRGRVVADVRAMLDGFHDESPSFVDWYEEWLDRALCEWARSALPLASRKGRARLDEDEAAALDMAAPLIERQADPAREPSTHDRLYPVGEHELAASLFHVRLYQDRLDEAEVQLDRVAHAEGGDGPGQTALCRAALLAARGQREATLSVIDEALTRDDLWFTSRTKLYEERERTLHALGRLAERADTAMTRARHARELFAWFDAAWARLDAGDVDGAAAALIEALSGGARVDTSLDQQQGVSVETTALRFAYQLFDALDQAGEGEKAAALKARLVHLGAQP